MCFPTLIGSAEEAEVTLENKLDIKSQSFTGSGLSHSQPAGPDDHQYHNAPQSLSSPRSDENSWPAICLLLAPKILENVDRTAVLAPTQSKMPRGV